MELILFLVSIFGLILIVFILTHLRPLDEDEVEQLAMKRRGKEIRKYFSFATVEFDVNKEFKKRINPNGTFYRVNEELFNFPSIAAALLKYKKHEWIIIAFEKQKKIDLIWLNKGFDRSCVSPYLSAMDIINIAMRGNYTSVLIFHNHPNPNPNYYNYSRPSSKDLESASELAHILNKFGINLVEFVCERGMHYEYFLSPSDSFFPISEFVMAINKINGLSWQENLLLHIERIF